MPSEPQPRFVGYLSVELEVELSAPDVDAAKDRLATALELCEPRIGGFVTRHGRYLLGKPAIRASRAWVRTVLEG